MKRRPLGAVAGVVPELEDCAFPPDGVVCGVPAVCENGRCRRVADLPIDVYARQMIDRSTAELREELAGAG